LEFDFIERIRRGDQGVIREIYTANYASIERMVLKNSGQLEDAKDVYQEAMIVFYKNVVRPEFVLTSAIQTYLYAISYRVWLKKLRDEKRIIIEEPNEIEEALEYELSSKNPNEALHQTMEMLKKYGKNCLDIMKRFYFHNQSFDLIANELGYASGQVVREKKYRCIKKVREGLNAKNVTYEF
jgi:RNA polymerase sigma factor (sigma-70 family)